MTRTHRPDTLRGILATLCVLLWLPAVCEARWAMPSDAPVERLVRNLEAHLKQHPLDASAWYSLGRTHSLAYSLKRSTLNVWERRDGAPVAPADDWQQGWVPRREEGAEAPPPPTEEELRAHLIGAVRALSMAIDLEPENASYHLSLASVLEAGSADAGSVRALPGTRAAGAPAPDWVEQQIAALPGEEAIETLRNGLGLGKDDWSARWRDGALASRLFELWDADDEAVRACVRSMLADDWRAQIGEQYFLAFCYALPRESLVRHRPLSGLNSLVAYEAGKAYVRLVEQGATLEPTAIRVAAVRAALDGFDNVSNNGPITPIVFDISPDAAKRTLADLLDDDARVTFDLDASGRGQTWSWVRPTTGILVWDPDHAGKITSGRQLFGSVTWWILFDNGYDALDTLDDDRDGWLSADELASLGVWFDRNSNGVSDPGEVLTLDEAGVSAIATRSTGTDTNAPCNRAGLVTTDGRVLPTYDWVTSPVEQPKAAAGAAIRADAPPSRVASRYLAQQGAASGPEHFIRAYECDTPDQCLLPTYEFMASPWAIDESMLHPWALTPREYAARSGTDTLRRLMPAPERAFTPMEALLLELSGEPETAFDEGAPGLPGGTMRRLTPEEIERMLHATPTSTDDDAPAHP